MRCIRMFSVAKKFMDKTREEVSNFSFSFFLSHSAKIFVGKPFIVSLISCIVTFMLRRVMSRFAVETFLSHGTGQNALTNPSVFHKTFRNEKCYG